MSNILNGDRLYNVTPTSTDSAGNGTYRASNGEFYYGNVQNGYLTPTQDTLNKRQQKESQNSQSTARSKNAQGSSSATPAKPSIAETLLLSACFGFGYHATNILLKAVDILLSIAKIYISLVLLLQMFTGKAEFCPFYGTHMLLDRIYVIGVLIFFIAALVLAIMRIADLSKIAYWALAVGCYILCLVNMPYGLIGNLVFGLIYAFFLVQFPRWILLFVSNRANN